MANSGSGIANNVASSSSATATTTTSNNNKNNSSTSSASSSMKQPPCCCNWEECRNYTKSLQLLSPQSDVWVGIPFRVEIRDVSPKNFKHNAMCFAIEKYLSPTPRLGDDGKPKPNKQYYVARHHFPRDLLLLKKSKFITSPLPEKECRTICSNGNRLLDSCNRLDSIQKKLGISVPKVEGYVCAPLVPRIDVEDRIRELQSASLLRRMKYGFIKAEIDDIIDGFTCNKQNTTTTTTTTNSNTAITTITTTNNNNIVKIQHQQQNQQQHQNLPQHQQYQQQQQQLYQKQNQQQKQHSKKRKSSTNNNNAASENDKTRRMQENQATTTQQQQMNSVVTPNNNSTGAGGTTKPHKVVRQYNKKKAMKVHQVPRR